VALQQKRQALGSYVRGGCDETDTSVTPHAAGRAFALLIAIAACGATELLSPSPALVATWDGTGGVVGEPLYSVALSIRELGDSVRGDWQIDFSSDRATDEGTFSGAM
jgi:hypothetical protein